MRHHPGLVLVDGELVGGMESRLGVAKVARSRLITCQSNEVITLALACLQLHPFWTGTRRDVWC
jgi:hypothetical protein